MKKRTCYECGRTKPLSEYHRGRGPGGRRIRCRDCLNDTPPKIPAALAVPHVEALIRELGGIRAASQAYGHRFNQRPDTASRAFLRILSNPEGRLKYDTYDRIVTLRRSLVRAGWFFLERSA